MRRNIIRAAKTVVRQSYSDRIPPPAKNFPNPYRPFFTEPRGDPPLPGEGGGTHGGYWRQVRRTGRAWPFRQLVRGRTACGRARNGGCSGRLCDCMHPGAHAARLGHHGCTTSALLVPDNPRICVVKPTHGDASHGRGLLRIRSGRRATCRCRVRAWASVRREAALGHRFGSCVSSACCSTHVGLRRAWYTRR